MYVCEREDSCYRKTEEVLCSKSSLGASLLPSECQCPMSNCNVAPSFDDLRLAL